MKVRFLKDHGFNKAGAEIDLPDGEANYLIRVHAAVGVIYEGEKEETAYQEKEEEAQKIQDYFEKENISHAKEKAENKTGNVPTAKKKKK